MYEGLRALFVIFTWTAVIGAIISIAVAIGLWKMFEKAGYEGYRAIIPLYNMFTLTEMSGMNGWYFLLCLIPYIGVIIWLVMVSSRIALAFGKDNIYAVGLILVPYVFYPVLGFGSAQYVYGNHAQQSYGPGQPSQPGQPTQPSTPAKPPKVEDPWVSGQV